MYLCYTTGAIHCIAASSDGQVMCSTAEDKSLKVFDVVNFGKSMNCGIFLNVAPFFDANLTSNIRVPCWTPYLEILLSVCTQFSH